MSLKSCWCNMTPPLATRIVETVAAAKQTDPRHLYPPLNDYLDAEALSRGLDSGAFGGWIEFTAWGCSVRVDAATGEVGVGETVVENGSEQVAD